MRAAKRLLELLENEECAEKGGYIPTHGQSTPPPAPPKDSFSSADDLRREIDMLREALQELYDVQNGPPLERERQQWEAAMEKAEDAIRGARGGVFP